MKFFVEDMKYQQRINELFQYREERQLDKIYEVANDLYEESKQEHVVQVQNISLYCLAELSFLKQNITDCLSKSHILLNYYDENENDIVYALTCNLLGTVYICKGDMYTAVTYLIRGLQQAKLERSSELTLKILTNIGTAFFDVDCYDEALSYYMKCFKELEKNNFSIEIYEGLLVNILVTYMRMQDLHNAILWEQKYAEVFENPKNVMGKSGILTYKVVRDIHQKQYDKLRLDMIELLHFFDNNWTGTFSIKLLLEVMETCIKENIYIFITDCLEIFDKHMQKDDYKTRLSLSVLCIQMYKKQNNKIKYAEELENYYQIHHKSIEKDSEVDYSNLKNIVILEEERFTKKKLLHKHKELSIKSQRDPFTGFLHKTSFMKQTNVYFENKSQHVLGVFMIIDIDDFKLINDRFGHLYGDKILSSITNILKKHIRKTDIIGRIGGDEFCIVLKNVKQLQAVHKKLTSILDDIKNVRIDENHLNISISIGVFATIRHYNYEKLFYIADKALYQAKADGKNTYVVIEDMNGDEI